MENSTPEVKKAVTQLPMRLHIKVDGQEREIFMSFALLNLLSHLIGDTDQLPLLHMNPQMREAILPELLAERSPAGKVIKPFTLFENEISIEDITLSLDFAAAHVLDFSLGAAEKSAALSQQAQSRMLALKSTLNGLADSALKK